MQELKMGRVPMFEEIRKSQTFTPPTVDTVLKAGEEAYFKVLESPSKFLNAEFFQTPRRVGKAKLLVIMGHNAYVTKCLSQNEIRRPSGIFV